MKTIHTFTGTFLMLLSLNTFAATLDSKPSEDHPKYLVENTPMVWGNAEESAPMELRFVKAKYAKVPVAPFVVGKPLDKTETSSFKNMKVPVAPFILGSPDEQGLEISGEQLSKYSKVAVAPFIWGNEASVNDAPDLH